MGRLGRHGKLAEGRGAAAAAARGPAAGFRRRLKGTVPDRSARQGRRGAVGFGADGTTNATMSPRQVRTFCKLDQGGELLLKQAMNELGLSARAHDKVLRIARTIADIEGEADIQSHHLAEAIRYRRLDRKL